MLRARACLLKVDANALDAGRVARSDLDLPLRHAKVLGKHFNQGLVGGTVDGSLLQVDDESVIRGFDQRAFG